MDERVTHGPHPEVMRFMFEAPAEMANFHTVMIDALDPLDVPQLPAGCEDPEYANSWRGSIAFAPDAGEHK